MPTTACTNPEALSDDGGLTEGLSLREGNYFNATAEVGTFEHSLTTDLLNHLVFVQKVFMKVWSGFSTSFGPQWHGFVCTQGDLCDDMLEYSLTGNQ